MPPINTQGATASGVREAMNWLHVHAAVATAQMSRMPALFTVPEIVMLVPNATPSV
jgi:hypothetical protein